MLSILISFGITLLILACIVFIIAMFFINPPIILYTGIMLVFCALGVVIFDLVWERVSDWLRLRKWRKR